MTGSKKFDTVEEVQRLYEYLQGETISAKGWRLNHLPKFKTPLDPDTAFSIIYLLQEEWSVIPDNFEICADCKEMYDADSEGYHLDNSGKHYCDNCLDEHWCICSVCETPFDKKGMKNFNEDRSVCEDCTKTEVEKL